MNLKTLLFAAMTLSLSSMLSDAAPLKATLSEQGRKGPDCGRDTSCEVWKQFRRGHPFPVQEVAAARAADSLVLIFSEPSMPKVELQQVVKQAFGADLRDQKVRRWMIGEDGWVEDLVVTVRYGAVKGAAAAPRPSGKGRSAETQPDFLDDRQLRDRLSLIAHRLWGTAFGLKLDSATLPFEPRARGSAANLDPHPSELLEWLSDSQLKWRPIGGTGAERVFSELSAAPIGDVYASTDNQMTLLQLTREDVRLAKLNPSAFANAWRAPFRKFAISTDVILGAAWQADGGIGFVGRMRRTGTDVLPPLRFETFALLARTGTSELAQSYERNTPFAGKMMSGRYAGADWAPIYLSPQLIDTEFGALLNITDQMLKSWSMAGDIDYLYFDYPLRPAAKRFAFGVTPLSDLVRRETGSTSVLFNWNTSGSAAVVSRLKLDVLTPTRTGALPVTYGAETTPGSGMKYGNQIESLQKHERDAYTYFSELRDPNLARVVSYTLIYQAFQAYGRQKASATDTGDPRVDVRQAATKSLVDELSQVLVELKQPDAAHRIIQSQVIAFEMRSGRKVTLDPARRQQLDADMRRDLEGLFKEIAAIQSLDSRYRNPQALAALLVDFRTEQRVAVADLIARQEAFNALVDRYNSAGKMARLGLPNQSELEATDAKLTADSKKLKEMSMRTERLHGLIQPVAASMRDLDQIRTRFTAASTSTSEGWIKTPSIVISQNSQSMRMIGGHNLNSTALRIEVDPAATEAKLVESGNVRVLRVPPGQADEAAARANDLARQIEHGKADIRSIRSALAENRAPAMKRTRLAALQGEPPSDMRLIAGRSGVEVLSDAQLRGQMLALYDALGKGVGANYAGMARREVNGDILVLTRAGDRADCCVRVHDLATFRDRLAEWKGQGDVALVDFEPAQARALARNLAGRDDAAMLEAVGGGHGGEPPVGNFSFISGNGEPPRNMGNGGGTTPPGGGKPPPGAGKDGNGGGTNPPKPPGGTGGQIDPMMVRMLIDHGQPVEVRAIMMKSRSIQRAGEAIEGAPAEAELQNLQRAAKLDDSRKALAWDTKRDGRPVIFRLRFLDVDPTVNSLEARVIAGVDPLQAPAAIKLLSESIDLARQGKPQGSLFDLQSRVKDLVDRSPDRLSVKRLITYVNEARNSFMMTRKDSAAPSNTG